MTNSAKNLAIAVCSLAAAVLSSACTNANAPAPSRLEATDDGSFTITQDMRVGLSVRSDFDAANDFLEEQQYDLAVERLLEVVEAAPQLVSAHINLGIAYRQLEEFEKAEASLQRAVELNRRHPVALNELGMVQRRQGKFQEARDSYTQALDVADDFHFARRNLAILCDLFLADVPCALENYERYAEAVPEDETVGMWIADLHRRSGNQPATRR